MSIQSNLVFCMFLPLNNLITHLRIFDWQPLNYHNYTITLVFSWKQSYFIFSNELKHAWTSCSGTIVFRKDWWKTIINYFAISPFTELHVLPVTIYIYVCFCFVFLDEMSLSCLESINLLSKLHILNFCVFHTKLCSAYIHYRSDCLFELIILDRNQQNKERFRTNYLLCFSSA